MKEGVLKNSTKFKLQQLCQSHFFNKVAGRLLNVVCTFNLRPVSTGKADIKVFSSYRILLYLFTLFRIFCPGMELVQCFLCNQIFVFISRPSFLRTPMFPFLL